MLINTTKTKQLVIGPWAKQNSSLSRLILLKGSQILNLWASMSIQNSHGKAH